MRCWLLILISAALAHAFVPGVASADMGVNDETRLAEIYQQGQDVIVTLDTIFHGHQVRQTLVRVGPDGSTVHLLDDQFIYQELEHAEQYCNEACYDSSLCDSQPSMCIDCGGYLCEPEGCGAACSFPLTDECVLPGSNYYTLFETGLYGPETKLFYVVNSGDDCLPDWVDDVGGACEQPDGSNAEGSIAGCVVGGLGARRGRSGVLFGVMLALGAGAILCGRRR